MIRGICVAVIVVMCIGLSEGWSEILNFNACWGIHYANDDKYFKLKWTGEDRGTGCKVTFNGYDSSDALDKYKICIKATTWDVKDSGVTLKYYSDEDVLDYDLQKTFTKYSSETPKTEWCSESDDYVNVELSTTGSSSSTIELKVYAEKTNENGQMVGIIVGSVIGGLVLFGIIVTVVIVIACNKRKGTSGTVLTNQNRGGQIIFTTQNATQPMAGFQNNAYASPPPAYNQITGYTYSGQQQYTGGQMIPNPS